MRTLTTFLGILAAIAMVSCAKGDPGGTGGNCGNQLVDIGEQCDGHNLGGLTCETIPGADFTGGMLGCSATCQLDTSACTGGSGVCGDGMVTGSEVCDGLNVNGATCESLGLMPGTLTCQAGCLDFDTSGCGVSPTCGNGVRDGVEECDGADLAGATCQILGYLSGTLACQANCLFDETGCHDAECGNGEAEGTEECDGFDLAGTTCMDLGHDGGTLACSASCTFDETLCGDAVCGNGVADGTEECDGADLAGEDCAGLGLGGGTLACSASCTFDTSGCTAPPACGDGVLNGTEECDTSDLGGQTCAGLGFAGGTLGCSASCTFDTSSCTSASGCAVLPFTEGFESGVPPPGGTDVDGSGSWEHWQSSSSAYSGSSCAYHYYDWLETDNDILVLPCIDLSMYSAGTTITMTFYEMNTLTGWYEGHYVVYSTATSAPGSVGSYSQLQEMGAGSSSWAQSTVDLSSLAGQPTVWIGFRYYGTDADTWYIDDVSITAN